jgi:hypothetical protein
VTALVPWVEPDPEKTGNAGFENGQRRRQRERARLRGHVPDAQEICKTIKQLSVVSCRNATS